MPCNAIAMATGKIATEDLAKLLYEHHDAVSQAMITYLQQEYPQYGPYLRRDVNDTAGGVTPARVYRGKWPANTICIWMGREGVKGDVLLLPDGTLRVTTEQDAAAGPIREELLELMSWMGAGLMGVSVKATLEAQGYVIEDEQRAADGSVVFTVEVGE